MGLYKTVKKEAKAERIIEKSRFIAHVKPISGRDEAEDFINDIRSRYKDATHNVPVMVIGDAFQIQWASDDGEPRGTAGAPIVQMMVKEEITNTAVVITRYFGGIKLGTGGLVRAYTGSAKLGLEAAEICNVEKILRMKVRSEYTYLQRFQSLSSSENGGGRGACESGAAFDIGDIEYADKVIMEILIRPENERKVKKLIDDMTAGSAEVVEIAETIEKVPVGGISS